jgi:hypothetical protein
MAREDEQGEKYLEGRGLEDGVELGLVRFATEAAPGQGDRLAGTPRLPDCGAARRRRRQPRGIQLRRCGEPRSKEPKILSVKGSSDRSKASSAGRT